MTDRISLWMSTRNLRKEIFDSDFETLHEGSVLIWSGEHRAYWGTDGSGYYDKPSAGIYTFSDAYRRTRHCGPEKQIEYERFVKPADPGPYRASRCPCGHPGCASWHVDPIAAVQGVSFTEEQAIAVADLLNTKVMR